MKLSETLVRHRVAAIIGMCKNAGKTTALNSLVRDWAGTALALTSVGLDGETTDQVTGTDKPPVYLRRGMLAATASGLLQRCDISREILAVTDASTPLGAVVVFRAMSDGFVQLAGPSMLSQLGELRDMLLDLGAERVLIDGALSRRSPAAGALDGAVVLSTGASYGRDISAVVSDTAFVCDIMSLKASAAVFPDAKEKFVVCKDGGYIGAETSSALAKLLAGGESVRVCGAFTGAACRSLVRSGAELEGVEFVLEDSTRAIITQEDMRSLTARGAGLSVMRASTLAAVTINPVSAYGWRFDRDEFFERMSAAVAVPVIDVEDEQ